MLRHFWSFYEQINGRQLCGRNADIKYSPENTVPSHILFTALYANIIVFTYNIILMFIDSGDPKIG